MSPKSPSSPKGETEQLPLGADPDTTGPPEDPTDPGPMPDEALGAYSPGASALAQTMIATRAVDTFNAPAVTHETAGTALAEQAKAEVEARYKMALLRPRDIDDFRLRLLKDCKRPSFAEVAEYEKPIGGKKVRGASIRFIETALRHYGNVIASSAAVFDDAEKRIVRVTVTDLETNFTVPMDITVEKTVERSQPKVDGDGQPQFISSRRNTYGKITYLVEATEDDMLNKERALISKAIRTNGERLLPPDIKEEALRLCRTTLRDRAAKDPDAERHRVADAFAGLGVTPPMLKDFLGHDFDESSPAELVDLRAVFTSIRDAESTWRDWIAAKVAATGNGEAARGTKAESLMSKLGPLGGGAKPANA